MIVNGQVDTADGGGLCQVASTLYITANYAGLKVLERHYHYAELPYIRPGFDATVWFVSLDMRFENTTGGHLLLREWVDEEGYVNAEIWGRPTGKKVEMESQLVSTSLDYEGNPFTEWVTRKKVELGGKIFPDGPIHRDTHGYLKPWRSREPGGPTRASRTRRPSRPRRTAALATDSVPLLLGSRVHAGSPRERCSIRDRQARAVS